MRRTFKCMNLSSSGIEINLFKLANLSNFLPQCLSTLLILLGVLAQMTGEAVSFGAASAATGITTPQATSSHQHQGVMHIHNNSSSTLPFIPSSTSILTAYQLMKSHHPGSSPDTSIIGNGFRSLNVAGQVTWQQPSKSLHRQQFIAGVQSHKQSNSEQKRINSSHQSIKQQLYVSTSGSNKSSGSQSLSNTATNSSTASNNVLVSVPIRHWWMAVYHHHGDQHSSDYQHSRVKRLLSLSKPKNLISSNFHECLQEELLNQGKHQDHPVDDILTMKGEPGWEDKVCSTSTLDARVRELLRALDKSCPDHRVCQVLSPEILQRLARPEQCRTEARNLWKNVFHKLYVMIRDFSDVLQQKFDIGDYSLEEKIERNQRCKEAYTFWICSTHLPMWLLNSDNKNSIKVEACQSTCLTVEKQCPFLIKGTEDDMASGNPSFMCKDASVPSTMSSTMCCYGKGTIPKPGDGVSINVSSGFCHEPDHVQLEIGTKNDNNTLSKAVPGNYAMGDTSIGGWSALHTSAATPNSAAGIAVDSYKSLPNFFSQNSGESKKAQSFSSPTSFSSNFHATSSCDKLLWPSSSINVTASEQAEKWSETYDQNETNYRKGRIRSLGEVSEEEGVNFFVALTKWLGFNKEEPKTDQDGSSVI